MSLILQLAEKLDALFESKAAVFSGETGSVVSVAGLLYVDAVQVKILAKALNWPIEFFDSGETTWDSDQLSQDFEPYSAKIKKPESEELRILTNAGFLALLSDDSDEASVWRIARLEKPIYTYKRAILNWDDSWIAADFPTRKSPRQLVKEQTSKRHAPEDIRGWLLVDRGHDFSDSTSQIWASQALRACLLSVADEINADEGILKFKGPPKLLLDVRPVDRSDIDTIGSSAFLALQAATDWIYELDRDAEVRHILFASELARTGDPQTDALLRFRSDCSDVFEAARIAYGLSVSEMGKDTLKTLADLKKAVGEDTSKVIESTRQMVTAVASATALGLGLIAAKLTTTTPWWLLFSLMVVVAIYVGIVIYSGFDFIKLQQSLRADWQPRLYRFLAPADYERMVLKPTRHAEHTFTIAAYAGGIVILLMLTILWCLVPISSK